MRNGAAVRVLRNLPKKRRRFTGYLFAGALGSMAGAQVSAQTAITIGGKIDIGYGRYLGEDDGKLRDGAGSRLNIRAKEDLGEGWFAGFALEHRYNPLTGEPSRADIFWSGYATVGLGHRTWGALNFGYQYTAAYSMVQNVIDPWGGDTVAQLRSAWRGGIARTRVADSLRYDLTYGQTRFAMSIADADDPLNINGGPDRPFSIGANTRIGALMLAAGWEDPAHPDDHLVNVGATYRIDKASLAAGLARGVTTRNENFRSALLALTYAIGSDEIRAGYVTSSTRRRDGFLRAQTSKFGLGYVHRLSRRTYLYANVAWDGKAEGNTRGYDVGLQHNF